MKKVIAFAQKGLVLNKDRTTILVIKYKSSKYLATKLVGKLALPGGRLEFGEEPDAQLVREVEEETGVTVTPLLPFYTWTWIYEKEGKQKQIVAIARLAEYEEGEIREATGEVETKLEKARWIKLSDINLEDFVEDERPVIEKFLEYREKNPFEL